MCTTIGFSYKEGVVFGRTLEIGMKLDNKILFVPRNKKEFIDLKETKFDSKYSTIGSGFPNKLSFGDGINEKGLMGCSNFFPKYASFSKEAIQGKINMTTSNAFDYLLTRCEDVNEVRKEVENIILVENVEGESPSKHNHFFFMDTKGNKIVLEPKDGVLIPHDNPYGVMTNSPDFEGHTSNLKNYIDLELEKIDEIKFKETTIPGDFTPKSRFIRAAYFLSNTDKDLEREVAILQAFRILSQFDIPKGTIVDSKRNHKDETLFTSVMDTKAKAYFIKCNENINIQSFYLKDYEDEKEIKYIELEKTMDL